AAPQKAPEKAPEQASAPAQDLAADADTSNKKRDDGPEQQVEGPKRGGAAAGPGGPGVPGGKVKPGEKEQKEPSKVVDITRGARPSAEPAAADLPPAPAAPSVRRMARELGVDIDGVSGPRADRRIPIEARKPHTKQLLVGAARARAGSAAASHPPVPDLWRR